MKAIKKIIIVVVVLGLLVAGGVFAYLKFFDSTKSGNSKADFTMQATDLIHQLDSNKEGISKKYTDHVLAVTGKVKEIDEKQFNVILSAGENAIITCTVDSADFVKNQSLLKKETSITMQGVFRACDGFDKKEQPVEADDLLSGIDSEKKAVIVKCFIKN
jgi:uncharacterized protein (UPF0333 family)